MNKEQQDLAWACLPKETRNEVIRCFKYASKNSKSDLQRGAADTFEHLFGSHNLTSDTEPEEMLMVERKKVQELYSSLKDRYEEVKTNPIPKNMGQGQDYIVSERSFINGAISELKLLFGDKCLPDKELNEDNFAKSKPSNVKKK